MQSDPPQASDDPREDTPAEEPVDTSIETPLEDAAEQAAVADPVEADEDRDYAEDVHRGLEVGEWDATEQARTVDLDDDYR